MQESQAVFDELPIRPSPGMHSSPTIAVVIPNYNAERYLAATLRSVLAQQGAFRLEVLVVDDGSSDGSVAMLKRDFPEVRVIEQPNAGVAAARNTGIAAATAEWVAFIDADDIWLPGKLQAQLELLDACGEAVRMCSTGWHVWTTQSVEPPEDMLRELAARVAGAPVQAAEAARTAWRYTELLQDCVVWTSTVLAQRSLLRELGGFDAGLRVGEDYDLWLRASRLTPIPRLDAPLALYRHHGANITHRAPERNFKGEVVQRALDRWGYQGPDGREASRTTVRAGLSRSWADFAGAQLLAGRRRRALPAACRAVRLKPSSLLGWTVLCKSLPGLLLADKADPGRTPQA
ncbi:glycosyltransferase family 2 protein [Roseateles asaccharophilus]|uniref:glycosyltransferase family 2 protein n=1 Tax=Roseateles asaccharophilus TaxID=582607 RepID=UPI00391B7088